MSNCPRANGFMRASPGPGADPLGGHLGSLASLSVCVLVACGKICLLGAESDPHFEFLSWVCLGGDPLRNHSCSGQAVVGAALTTDYVRRPFLMGGSYRLWPAAGRGRKQRGYFKKELPDPAESSFSFGRLNREPVVATFRGNKKNYSHSPSFQGFSLLLINR